jgi:riboflavin biosynthesis pyrimidine reductase
LDELCLTVAPVLAGGDAGRIAVGQRRSALGALQLVGAVESDAHVAAAALRLNE